MVLSSAIARETGTAPSLAIFCRWFFMWLASFLPRRGVAPGRFLRFGPVPSAGGAEAAGAAGAGVGAAAGAATGASAGGASAAGAAVFLAMCVSAPKRVAATLRLDGDSHAPGGAGDDAGRVVH